MPIGANWINEARWYELFRGLWAAEEHNNVLELRCVVSVLRHLARSSRCWHKRVVIMTDSVVSMGVLQKGRSSATALLRLARVACGISLALGIRGYYRWVPSQWNMADGPSRGVDIGAADETKEAHRMRTTPKAVRPLLKVLERRE